MKRENVTGRANVADTPELEAYYRALEGEELGALWNVANEIEPWYPQPNSVPTLWKWQKVEPFVRRAADLVSAEKAARRVVMLVNPGRKEWSAAAGLLYTGVQVMNPGEAASAHRHQASALRFVMEGNGAYTTSTASASISARATRAHARTAPGTSTASTRAARSASAGRARHPADEFARRELLRGAIEKPRQTPS
jgi:hypothetical protein